MYFQSINLSYWCQTCFCSRISVCGEEFCFRKVFGCSRSTVITILSPETDKTISFIFLNVNLESAFLQGCPAGTSHSICPKGTHYLQLHYNSLLMFPSVVNGIAFIQPPYPQTSASFLTFPSTFHPVYSYSQCFWTPSSSVTRISPLPLAEKTCLYSQPCHLSWTWRRA